MTEAAKTLSNNRFSSFLVFIPFAPLLLRLFMDFMPLNWLSLATLLRSISLISIKVNIAVNDVVWSMLGIWAYIIVSMPIYKNLVKKQHVVPGDVHSQNLTFSKLFRTCASAVFSDYKISLMSKIPLTLQILAGGSLLYEIFGADWIMHALAGFGVGAIALKAYVTGVNHYGYNRLAAYFRLDRFKTFKSERKNASAEFTLFSIAVVATVWEIFEISVYLLSPNNVLRIRAEPLWNITGDLAFAIIGGMMAWHILRNRLKQP